ncbi:hypothetical protein Gohar_001136, partial [Gossypium harknessii]|nr:hypothetical protein [Gossypium harknessii]
MVVDLTPVQTLSWKEKLLGKGYLDQKGVSEATSLEADDDFVLLDDDIKRSFVNDIPSIEFLAKINQLLIKDMSTSVPSMPFQLMDIENDYFLVKFQNSKDYEKISKPPRPCVQKEDTLGNWQNGRK